MIISKILKKCRIFQIVEQVPDNVRLQQIYSISAFLMVIFHDPAKWFFIIFKLFSNMVNDDNILANMPKIQEKKQIQIRKRRRAISIELIKFAKRKF